MIQSIVEWAESLNDPRKYTCTSCGHHFMYQHEYKYVKGTIIEFNENCMLLAGKCRVRKCKCKDFTLDTIEDFVHNLRSKQLTKRKPVKIKKEVR